MFLTGVIQEIAKAPQSFWLDDIWGAHEKIIFLRVENNCIDSCTNDAKNMVSIFI